MPMRMARSRRNACSEKPRRVRALVISRRMRTMAATTADHMGRNDIALRPLRQLSRSNHAERIAIGLAELKFDLRDGRAQAGGQALEDGSFGIGMKRGDDGQAALGGAQGVVVAH